MGVKWSIQKVKNRGYIKKRLDVSPLPKSDNLLIKIISSSIREYGYGNGKSYRGKVPDKMTSIKVTQHQFRKIAERFIVWQDDRLRRMKKSKRDKNGKKRSLGKKL